MTPAQRRRARKKANRKAKRERLAGGGMISPTFPNGNYPPAGVASPAMSVRPNWGGNSRQAEVGAQIAINAAEKLKAKFAKKRGETGNAAD